jgi:hypothetical protein
MRRDNTNIHSFCCTNLWASKSLFRVWGYCHHRRTIAIRRNDSRYAVCLAVSNKHRVILVWVEDKVLVAWANRSNESDVTLPCLPWQQKPPVLPIG